MGSTSYYRKFIESFSQIANPITSLQKKGVKFIWIQKCEESFRLLQEFLARALILKLPDSWKDYVVCTDASLQGLGGFFMQDGDVICYE